MTIIARVKRDLNNGKTITPLRALKQYGCFRLADVIHRLRTEQGMNVQTIEVRRNGKRFASYRLAGV